MSKLIIEGGHSLSGQIAVSGAKNEALKVLAAALLFDTPLIVRRVPAIEDITRLVEILESIGGRVSVNGEEYTIDPRFLTTPELPTNLVESLRASIVLTGPLLAKFGQVRFPHPGGCAIGQRPIDFFIQGYRALGAQVEVVGEHYEIHAPKLHGGTVVFPIPSVTGTETFAMLATQIEGTTVIENAAREPEVVHLLEYLNASGARIKGIGTGTLRLEGKTELTPPGPIEVIPDRIEAGSFLALAAATKSSLTITGCQPEHLTIPIATLAQMGVTVTTATDAITVKPTENLLPVPIITREYPGFPTDILPPFIVLATQSSGESLMHETIYEGRLFFIDKLNRMGARVLLCDPHRALVMGPTPLTGAKLESPDIRAGLALIIAGLIAKGKTTIENAYQIDRGYERIDERLRALGAQIERID